LRKPFGPQELNKVAAKIPINYVNRITSFQKKHDAVLICLILNATEIQNWRGIGYHLPNDPVETLSGLQGYPMLFCSAPNQVVANFHPALVMMINEHSQKFSTQPEHVAFLYDQKKQHSYFLTLIQPALYLAMIFGVRKTEKESAILNFASELSADLRCFKQFYFLKSHTKPQ